MAPPNYEINPRHHFINLCTEYTYGIAYPFSYADQLAIVRALVKTEWLKGCGERARVMDVADKLLAMLKEGNPGTDDALCLRVVALAHEALVQMNMNAMIGPANLGQNFPFRGGP